MKISDFSQNDIAEFLRVEPEEVQEYAINNAMEASRAFIKSYTGLTQEEIDAHPDITTAYLVLVQDMYDNRSISSDGKGANPTVTSILNMYARNLL